MQCASDVLTSLLWFNESREDGEPSIIEQFVQNVEDFSSQYGSEISVSYTACNIRGPPSNFPDYGDYPQAFLMAIQCIFLYYRTYGTWWDEAPSAQDDYMPQNNRAIPSQDYVEVSFEHPVLPLEVSVFETYNPGAIVRIWARGHTTWMLLWEGEPVYVGDKPRIFSPPIKQINVPTRILRLEFNHKLLPYYTELDAILLKGREPTGAEIENAKNASLISNNKNLNLVEKGRILSKVIEANLHDCFVTKDVFRDNLDTGPNLGDFQLLPNETMLYIMKYLDLQSLCRCAQVNKHFNRLASDSILYRKLDLRPYWHCVNSQVLVTLSMKCKHLQKLDLSWCGNHRMINSNYVVSFLKDCGAELTHLKLNCCKFVDNSVLHAIVNYSIHLQELCLRSVTGQLDWGCLSSLTKLKRLDLYRTDISTLAVVTIIRKNTNLEHLNVGSCKMISSMDDVAISLGSYCPELISVDFWKSYSLSPNGVRALGNCKKLQELDVGWCSQVGASGEWLACLSGTEIKKLFLGALRGISDRDLKALIQRSPNLTQLDLVGVRSITPDVVETILSECKMLRLLDISFCDLIMESQIKHWRDTYPGVSIKRSFQSSNMTTAPNPLFLAPSLD